MLFKFGFFVVFLLLFQSYEAKKKKQSTAVSTISSYVEDIKAFILDAWDALLDLIPTKPASSTKTKKKKGQDDWGLNSMVKSATRNWNYLYKSVSSSLDVFQVERKNRPPEDDPHVENVFYIEVSAAEILEKITTGLVNFVSNFDKKR